MLRLKGAECFLETSESTLRTQQCVSGEKSDYERRKEQILSGIGEDPH